jgi:hypothetical protein
MAVSPELDFTNNHPRCAGHRNRTRPTWAGERNRQPCTARASRQLSITINQMGERAHLNNEAGTSSRNDGTADEKLNMLEE